MPTAYSLDNLLAQQQQLRPEREAWARWRVYGWSFNDLPMSLLDVACWMARTEDPAGNWELWKECYKNGDTNEAKRLSARLWNEASNKHFDYSIENLVAWKKHDGDPAHREIMKPVYQQLDFLIENNVPFPVGKFPDIKYGYLEKYGNYRVRTGTDPGGMEGGTYPGFWVKTGEIVSFDRVPADLRIFLPQGDLKPAFEAGVQAALKHQEKVLREAVAMPAPRMLSAAEIEVPKNIPFRFSSSGMFLDNGLPDEHRKRLGAILAKSGIEFLEADGNRAIIYSEGRYGCRSSSDYHPFQRGKGKMDYDWGQTPQKFGFSTPLMKGSESVERYQKLLLALYENGWRSSSDCADSVHFRMDGGLNGATAKRSWEAKEPAENLAHAFSRESNLSAIRGYMPEELRQKALECNIVQDKEGKKETTLGHGPEVRLRNPAGFITNSICDLGGLPANRSTDNLRFFTTAMRFAEEAYHNPDAKFPQFNAVSTPVASRPVAAIAPVQDRRPAGNPMPGLPAHLKK